MKDKNEKVFKYWLSAISLVAILLLTVPTLMILFYSISKFWFITLNTIGLILVTIRLVISVAVNVSIHAVQGSKTKFKKKLDIEAWFLFVSTLLIQLVNLMFVHFN